MLFLIRFTKTHFLHPPNYGYWDVSYIVGKVWMRRLQRRWNRRKRFSNDGVIPRTSMIRPRDRKSTRLNSSHQIISYAVFCLKKKKSFRIRLQYRSFRRKPISSRSLAVAPPDSAASHRPPNGPAPWCPVAPPYPPVSAPSRG